MNRKYKPELNFLTQFKLSRNGMILELKEEFDILRLAMSKISELDKEYSDMLDRIMVVTLRKLLFENQHNSVLRELCAEFKMPKLDGFNFVGEDKLNIILPPYKSGSQKEWILLNDWQNQKIAYFNKTEDDVPAIISDELFCTILRKLKGTDKNTFKSLYVADTICYKGENINVYCIKNNEYEKHKKVVFELMKKVGYYDLTIYDFIKHISDKRGAHIDFEIAPLVKMMNGSDRNTVTAIQCFSLQLIYAAKCQIPELFDYWPEFIALP